MRHKRLNGYHKPQCYKYLQNNENEHKTESHLPKFYLSRNLNLIMAATYQNYFNKPFLWQIFNKTHSIAYLQNLVTEN